MVEGGWVGDRLQAYMDKNEVPTGGLFRRFVVHKESPLNDFYLQREKGRAVETTILLILGSRWQWKLLKVGRSSTEHHRLIRISSRSFEVGCLRPIYPSILTQHLSKGGQVGIESVA